MSNLNLLKSKDNAIEMLKLTKDGVFSGSLDQKDVVKLSVDLVGESKEISYDSEQRITSSCFNQL